MMNRISRLHYITQQVEGCSHAALAEEACKGKADWVQLRVKGLGYISWLDIAREAKAVCDRYNAKLIINDSPFIAKEVGAAGVHLGKEDMSPSEARQVMGEGFIIGGTANTPEDVKRLEKQGVDYIGLGPFRFTTTKEKLSPVLGIEGIAAIVSMTSVPVIAIGGIKREDVPSLMRTGIHGIAVSSAINLADDRSGAMEALLLEVNKNVKQVEKSI